MKPLKGFRTSLALAVLTVLGLATSQSAHAAKIDFESVPGVSNPPPTGLQITDQFYNSYGVKFSLLDQNNNSLQNEFPLLAGVGSDNPLAFISAYGNHNNTPDPAYAQDVGQRFLTFAGFPNRAASDLPKLLITYNNPVAAASAAILDIDGQPTGELEQWTIEALGQSNNVLETQILKAPSGVGKDPSQPGYPGDGIPVYWSFGNRPQADIYSIRISYTGNKKTGVGLGFDNFNTDSPSPKSVPEPASVIGLLALGAFGAGSLLKRKKSAVG